MLKNYHHLITFHKNLWTFQLFIIFIIMLRGAYDKFPDFFRMGILMIVQTWNSSPLRSNLLRLQWTCTVQQLLEGIMDVLLYERVNDLRHSLFHLLNCFIMTASEPKSHREQGLDYREDEEVLWCLSWSNSLWQGWSCGVVHCPSGNATEPICRVLASSDGIPSWTPLEPQHSNPNPNPLANQLWCIDFLTPPTPLIIPHRLPTFFESLIPLKNDARFMPDALKVVWSITYVSVAFFPSFKHNFIVYRSFKV